MSEYGLEVYPIVHRERHYQLIAPSEIDMTFVEVRAMLDWLNARGAFSPDADASDPGAIYTCELPGVVLEIDVRGIEVLVLRRTER